MIKQDYKTMLLIKQWVLCGWYIIKQNSKINI